MGRNPRPVTSGSQSITQIKVRTGGSQPPYTMAMTRGLALVICACGLLSAAPAGNKSASHKPTFSKDVAPIIQQHCQSCHRPGEPAPFSLLTYKDARPWASAIKEAVQLRKMP